MSTVMALVREDLRDFGGYRSARTDTVTGAVWLNANEAATASASDPDARMLRYPDPQPAALRAALASLYGCRPEQLLAGRGSDEAIDLLVRALCRPGGDAIVISTPTFGMYAVSARLNATRVVDVPLTETPEGFACDFEAITAAVLESGARIVFLCSPGNPTGHAPPLQDVDALAARLHGEAIVVVDEAYQEFSDGPSAIGLLDRHENIAVLRTLSKAHALAGVRLGSVIGAPALIDVLRRCQAPYPLPTPCVTEALRALAPDALAETRTRVQRTVAERDRVRRGLAAIPGVRRVYSSSANFLLVRFDDAEAAYTGLLAAGIVVRDMRAQPSLHDALRISIGRPQENDAVLESLSVGALA